LADGCRKPAFDHRRLLMPLARLSPRR
jgi:hypothetical protein